MLEMRGRHRQLRPRRVVVGGNYKCLLSAGSEKEMVVVGASLQMANRKRQGSLGGGNIVSIHKKEEGSNGRVGRQPKRRAFSY